MEKTSRGAVVPANAVWSGVGSWRALAHEADANGNTIAGHRHQKLPLAAPGCLVVAIGLDAAATTTACSTTASRTRHIDGVPHLAQKGKLYNGFGTIKPTGHEARRPTWRRTASSHAARWWTCRGFKGVDCLGPGTAVTTAPAQTEEEQ